MDWVDSQEAESQKTASQQTSSSTGSGSRKRKLKSQKGRKGKPRLKKDKTKVSSAPTLREQLATMLEQPQDLWTSAYRQSLQGLEWPARCSAETTFLWSAVIEEQAEVLSIAGVSKAALLRLHEDLAANEVQTSADQELSEVAFTWLKTADSYPQDALAVAALAWDLGEQIQASGQEWLPKWYQNLLDLIETYEPDHENSVVCHLIMQCELPLLLACAAQGTTKPADDTNKAMEILAEHLQAGQKNPDAWLLYGGTYLRAGLASVLRCVVLAEALGLKKWQAKQQKALASLLVHAARWSRPDGTQLLATDVCSPRHKAIWDALQAKSSCSKSIASALTLSGIGKGKRSEVKQHVRPTNLPALTFYSENTSGACLQCDWRQKGGRVAVDFSDSEMCIEALGPKGLPVLAGEWTTRVTFNGEPQTQVDEWSEVCWFSDEDVDYLELQAEFGKQARVQRQIILFRAERLLYLADALITDSIAELSIRGRLPLASNTSFKPAEKTTEGAIVNRAGSSCLVLPIFLPEWRRQLSISGDSSCLTMEEDDLLVNAEANARRIYMPVLLSLSQNHSKQPYTWRHLTVADELRIVEHDEARAFRIQLGQEQFLAYCNLASPVRRTAMGLHTMADFYAARFDAEDGECETLVEVDPPAHEAETNAR